MGNYRIREHRGAKTLTGQFAGRLKYNLVSLAALIDDCDDDTAPFVDCLITATAPWGGYVKVEPYVIGSGGTFPSFPGDVDVGIRLTAVSGFGDTATTDIFITITTAPSGVPTGSFGTTVEVAFTGTFGFTFSLESLLVQETIGEFPFNYGGVNVVDSPAQEDVSLYERFVPGVAVTATIEAEANFAVSSAVGQPPGDYEQSGSASASDTITDHELFGNYGVSVAIQGQANNDTLSLSCGFNSWLGASLPLLTRTAIAGGASTTATASGLTASLTCSASSTCQEARGSVSFTVAPNRRARCEGSVRRMEEGYPVAQIQVWDGAAFQDVTADSNGLWNYDIEQEQYSRSVFAFASDSDATPATDTQSAADAVNEWNGIYARLKASWLAAEGLEPSLWRHTFRCFAPYEVFTLSQAAEHDVSSAYSGTGAGDISRTISEANGAAPELHGDPGTWQDFSLLGYAYLSIRIKADVAGSPFTVKIGAKEWSRDRDGAALVAGTAFAIFIIDLLNPTNGTADVDDKDSRFPYTSTSPIVVAITDCWPPANVATIVLTDLAATTYDVDYIKVIREDYSNVTTLHGYDYFVPAAVGDTSQYLLRLMTGNTDGARSLEQIALIYNTGTLAYTHRTIEDVIESLGGEGGDFPTEGWVVTPKGFDTSGCGVALPDLDLLEECWLTDERPAAWIEGGGAMHENRDWTTSWRRDCSTSQTYRAQMIADELIWWMPALDVLEMGEAPDEDGILQMRFVSLLKSRAKGVVFNQERERAVGVQVEIDGGTYGEAVCAPDGTYRTGLPYVPGGITAEVSAPIGDPAPSANIDFKTRVEHRVCFRVAIVSAIIYNLHQDWHGHLHTVGTDGSSILYNRSNFSLPLPGWAVEAAEVLDSPADTRAVVLRDVNDRIIVLFDSGGDLYETISDDEGATWNEATMAIPGGTNSCIVGGESGNLLEVAYVSGVLQGRFRAQGDADWSEIFTLKDDAENDLSVEDYCFSIDDAYDSPDSYTMTVVIGGETASSLWFSTDHARTWTRIT